ncbi:cellular retinoic acid-binding protein 2-like [Lineus longissimus]|uniref:cellular retinoic acid-binding protein 2-like n=1 Tax=Lineus longissimus TaxID=88925 RepID=UPI002B4CB15A
MSKPEDLVGKWKLDRSECFEEFTEAVGMNYVARKVAATSKPTCDIKIEGDKFTLDVHAIVFTKTEIIYTHGNEYESKAIDGTKIKCVGRWEEGKIIMDCEPVDASSTLPKQTYTREIVDGELLTTVVVHSDPEIVCRRYFKKCE